MEQDNEIYEGQMPDDGERLSGLKYSNSKKTPSFVSVGYGKEGDNEGRPSGKCPFIS